jgi:cell division protein ZapA
MPTPKPPQNPRSPADLSYVTVEIYDQTYHLSGPDPAHVHRLASLVDSRMRAVASTGRTADSLRVAVLAALNLADELARAETRLQQLGETLEAAESADLHVRAVKLRGMLDAVLEEDRRTAS